ncbi:MAG: DUF3568 family protein [Desulfobacterales bacterium]
MPTPNNLHSKNRWPVNGLRTYCVVFLLLFLSGCTAVALTGAGVGVGYTLSNVAYRSFSAPVDRVHDATVDALKKMGIHIIDDTRSGDGRTITAVTSELDIIIGLEKVTSKTTKVKVDARKNYLLKDKATAAEIINQVGKILGE